MIPTIGIVPRGGDEPPRLETGKPAFWRSCHSALKCRQVRTDGRVRLWNLYWMETMSFTSTPRKAPGSAHGDRSEFSEFVWSEGGVR